MAGEAVLYEVRGDGVAVVTINRPEAKNAMTKAAAEGIAAAMDRLDAEDSLRVGILTGAGGTFCSGMDLKGFLKGERPSIPGRGFAGLTEAPPKKPLIAAVDALHARATLDDAEFAALSAHYDDDQVLEIILLCGFYRTVSYLANALALPLEATAARFPQ